MKQNFLKFTAVLLIVLGVFACTDKEDERLPSNHAKGEIIAILDGCYGEIVIIELEAPKTLGTQGSFSYYNTEIKYNNAIAVPYFSKILIQEDNDTTQKIGTCLHFEFREKTEGDEALFMSNIACPAILAPPAIRHCIIMKIINYQNSKQ